MKKLTFEVNDSVYPSFVEAFKDCNMALLRSAENALLDSKDDLAKDLLRQIIKNLDSIKDIPEKVVAAPKKLEPFKLPDDTKEAIAFKRLNDQGKAQHIQTEGERKADEAYKNEKPKLTPHQAGVLVADAEKQKRKRRTKAEMEAK